MRWQDILRRRSRVHLAVLSLLAVALLYCFAIAVRPRYTQYIDASAVRLNEDGSPTVDLVMASMAKDNISWVDGCAADRGWAKVAFVVDSDTAQHRVPVNKGREAMVYLTYLIENYERLPDISIFIHADRYQWHVDDPLYDQIPTLYALQLQTVLSKGFVQLRCTWAVGCPEEIHVASVLRAPNDHQKTESEYAAAFHTLFPQQNLPDVVAVSCCSQFAVSRNTVLSRSKGYYEHVRQWLIDTTLDDATSGRILEYAWHIMFGMPAVHCPAPQVCYCETYGLCNLTGCTERNCDERYKLPPFSNMPNGWPQYGWDGKLRITPGG